MAVSSKKEEKTRYLELNNDLKSGNYRPMYLLYGSEEYLKTSYKKMFRQAIGGEDGMNYQLFEGMPDVDTLIDALETMPFFAEHRLVLISGSGLFKRRRRSGSSRICRRCRDPATSCSSKTRWTSGTSSTSW